MPSNVLIIVSTVGLALLASAAFAVEPEVQQEDWPGHGLEYVVPDTHTICLQGSGSIECTSTRLTPDPEDCPPGEGLIAVWRYGKLRHVCARP
jgi:hypothetical protein